MPTITFVITDLHRGGSPLLLASLAPALAKRFDNAVKIEVVSIAPPAEISSLLRKQGIKTLSLQARSNRDFQVIPRFVEYLNLRRPDLVFSILIHANLLVALSRPHTDHPFHWIQSIHTVQEKPAWHWYAQGLISGMADAVVAPSRAILTKMQAYGPVPRPIVIPNGIDVPRFQNALPIDHPPWPNDVTVVGYIGRFDPVKRLPLLIHAMKLLPQNYHLALVGYGTQEPYLRRLVTESAIGKKQSPFSSRIHFIPPTSEPERWYKSFHLFCSPSKSEGFGLTFAEATAAGIPVIACETAAARGTLGNALWVPTDPTPAEISQKIGLPPAKMRLDSGRSVVVSVTEMVEKYAEVVANFLPKSPNS